MTARARRGLLVPIVVGAVVGVIVFGTLGLVHLHGGDDSDQPTSSVSPPDAPPATTPTGSTSSVDAAEGEPPMTPVTAEPTPRWTTALHHSVECQSVHRSALLFGYLGPESPPVSHVVSLDSNDGSLKWDVAVPDGGFNCHLKVQDGLVLYASDAASNAGSTLVRIDPERGRVMWSSALPSLRIGVVAISRGRIVVSSNAGDAASFTTVDAATGAIGPEDVVGGQHYIVSGDRILSMSDDDILVLSIPELATMARAEAHFDPQAQTLDYPDWKCDVSAFGYAYRFLAARDGGFFAAEGEEVSAFDDQAHRLWTINPSIGTLYSVVTDDAGDAFVTGSEGVAVLGSEDDDNPMVMWSSSTGCFAGSSGASAAASKTFFIRQVDSVQLFKAEGGLYEREPRSTLRPLSPDAFTSSVLGGLYVQAHHQQWSAPLEASMQTESVGFLADDGELRWYSDFGPRLSTSTRLGDDGFVLFLYTDTDLGSVDTVQFWE